jgi:hypothetical protein
MDLGSLQLDRTGFTIWLKEPDANREGLPPPAASSLIKSRIDCSARTSQFLAIDLHDAQDHSLHGVRPNITTPIVIQPGTTPDKIAERLCPEEPKR